VKSESRSTV